MFENPLSLLSTLDKFHYFIQIYIAERKNISFENRNSKNEYLFRLPECLYFKLFLSPQFDAMQKKSLIFAIGPGMLQPHL